MKKVFFLLAFSVLTAVSSMAQSQIFNNPDNRAYWGVRVAGEITCPGQVKMDNVGMDVYNNGGGFEIGGIYNIPVVANFYIEPGLKLFYNTIPAKSEVLGAFEEMDFPISSLTFKEFGMRVPVVAGYHFDFTENVKFMIFTGPEFEVGLSGKTHIKGQGFSYSENVYGENGGMSRFNLLWDLGFGITYKQFYFGVTGGIGLLNMYKEGPDKFHENRVNFTLGYNF